MGTLWLNWNKSEFYHWLYWSFDFPPSLLEEDVKLLFLSFVGHKSLHGPENLCLYSAAQRKQGYSAIKAEC